MGVPGSANLLLLGGEQGYKIERSLRFNSADSAYCSRVPASAGDRRTFTWSLWIKRAAALAANQRIFDVYDAGTGFTDTLYFGTGDAMSFWLRDASSGVFTTTQVFRDCSAWYHIVLAIDTTQSTSTDRIKLYVNGSQVTAFSSITYPSQNYDCYINNTGAHNIGRSTGASQYLNGLVTECYLIDGQALTPSSFGETDTITGVWKPKKYAGTYGTNGFYLNFSDNSGTTSTTLGKDSSGNSNNWTPNNFSVTAGAGNDSMIDTPTPYADGGNGRGNYCTWNPLDKSSQVTLTNGNLNATATVADWRAVAGTFGMSTGKWYWEVTVTGATYHLIGIAKAGVNFASYVGSDANGWGYYAQSGTYNNGSYINTSTFASYTTGDVIGVAFDASAGSLYFYKNGTAQNSGNAAYTGLTSGPYFPATSHFSSTSSDANFGQRPFAYTPPSGFVALNTQNLPEPSIKKPSSYFDVKLYSGTNASQSITGLGFSPDLIWFKNRTGTAWHALFDSVRGRAAGLSSNVTDAESTSSAGNDLVSFDANGFTLGPVQNWNSTNGSGNSIVAWCWDESATPGFDIVTYTGTGSNRTVSHSLGVAPSLLIVKVRDYSPESWFVWHKNFPGTDFVKLDSTDAKASSASLWNSTVPTSSVFSLGTSAAGNRSGNAFVAYLWSEVAGFSKFGSYTGNGSSDGPFVFCGFRPRWVMIKCSSSALSWYILDTARDTYNTVSKFLYPDQSAAEVDGGAGVYVDYLSNGFKWRSSASAFNANGATYIFAAFAEAPFKYALAR